MLSAGPAQPLNPCSTRTYDRDEQGAGEAQLTRVAAEQAK